MPKEFETHGRGHTVVLNNIVISTLDFQISRIVITVKYCTHYCTSYERKMTSQLDGMSLAKWVKGD